MPASEVSEWLKSIPLDDDEIDEFGEAAELFEKQKIHRFDRLLALNDAQWGRLGLPLGVEASIRDALAQQFPETDKAELPIAAKNLGNFGNSRQPTAQESAQQRRVNQNLSNSSKNFGFDSSNQRFDDFGQGGSMFGEDEHGDPDEFGSFVNVDSDDGLGGFQDSGLRNNVISVFSSSFFTLFRRLNFEMV